MLAVCNAFIIAPAPAEATQLGRMAERVGFGDIASSFSPHRPVHPLTFFILHYRLAETAMQRVIEEVRGSDDTEIRYAPIILFTDDCPVERLLGYIRLGFDDVIALPEKREELATRLGGQLQSEQVYYETDDYLGPDRRRMELPTHRDERRTGTAPFARLIVQRDPTKGIRVRRHQTIGQPQRAMPQEATQFLPRQSTPGASVSRSLH